MFKQPPSFSSQEHYLDVQSAKEIDKWSDSADELLDTDTKIFYHMLNNGSYDRQFSEEHNAMWGNRRGQAHQCRQLRYNVYKMLDDRCDHAERTRIIRGSYPTWIEGMDARGQVGRIYLHMTPLNAHIKYLRQMFLSINSIGRMDLMRWLLLKALLVEDKSNYFAYPESQRKDLVAEKKTINRLRGRLWKLKWSMVKDIFIILFTGIRSSSTWLP
jgi:hypothetical protein